VAHTYTKLLYHVVFSTKERAPFIDAEVASDLHAYYGGIVRELKGEAVIVGGAADHLHALLRLPPSLSISEAMRVVKANTSLWVHQTRPRLSAFAWQTGYAAFTVSRSGAHAVAHYIATQEEHHRRMSYQDELRELLRRHDIDYDEAYLWD
jgi:REP element-mobilizing transposase RayT